jgi:hypothetical protein
MKATECSGTVALARIEGSSEGFMATLSHGMDRWAAIRPLRIAPSYFLTQTRLRNNINAAMEGGATKEMGTFWGLMDERVTRAQKDHCEFKRVEGAALLWRRLQDSVRESLSRCLSAVSFNPADDDPQVAHSNAGRPASDFFLYH